MFVPNIHHISGVENIETDALSRLPSTTDSKDKTIKGYKNRIAFANAIMKYYVNNRGDQSLHYNIKQ